jgi:hypothetical protein
MMMKYEIKKHRAFKNNTEKQCYAFLSADVQGANELPAMFDDGQNKVAVIAQNCFEKMVAIREKTCKGLVSKSFIKAVVSADQQKADFYNNADEEPFMTLVKCK